MAKKNIAKTMASVTGVIILGKILGFVKQILTANAFGATIQTDIISLSEGLISNTDYLLIQALSTAFIPTYIATKAKANEDTSKFVSNTIKIFFIITLLISTLLFSFSPLISRLLAPSYTVELSKELSKYIRVFSPLLIIIVQLAIFNALLKANESFIPGEFISFNQSVIIIILVLGVGNIYGPNTLVIASFAYSIFNLFFLMAYSKKRWRLLRGNPFKDENVKKLLKMMGPLILGYSMVFVNQQVDKIIVSGLGDGTVTAMNYASVLSNLVGTFIGSICGVLFVYISKNIVEENDKEAAKLTITSLIQIGALLLPISIIVMMNGADIVTIVFGRGKFDAPAIESCSAALVGYGFMFVPYLIRELFSRFQYAYNDSKTPMRNSIISIIVNIILSVVLSKIIGVMGVALATSISVFVCAVLNISSSRKRNRDIKIRGNGKNIMRCLIGIVICILLSILGKRILIGYSSLIRFIFITVFSVGIYGAVTFPIIKPLIQKLFRKTQESC